MSQNVVLAVIETSPAVVVLGAAFAVIGAGRLVLRLIRPLRRRGR